jgi:hypothetical protein
MLFAVTRTMPVGNGGRFTYEARLIYELVYDMQEVLPEEIHGIFSLNFSVSKQTCIGMRSSCSATACSCADSSG